MPRCQRHGNTTVLEARECHDAKGTGMLRCQRHGNATVLEARECHSTGGTGIPRCQRHGNATVLEARKTVYAVSQQIYAAHAPPFGYLQLRNFAICNCSLAVFGYSFL